MNLILLLATFAALLSGPLIYAVARARPSLLAFLDGFVLVSIAGLVLLEVVPGTFSDGGWWSAAFLLLGLLGPTLVERLMSRAQREAHIAALTLAIFGLVVHSLGDGAALSPGAGEHHFALALAVVIHSVPVGLVVWWLMYPVFGGPLPSLVLATMCIGTAAGYWYGIELSEILDRESWAWLQALVAGSILHVVFGRPHIDEDSGHHESHPPYEGLGNLTALLALIVLGSMHADGHTQSDFLHRFADLALESAPALLLAYLVGGFVSGELPDSWMRWIGRGGTASQSLRGMAMGLPLPICSCGVLPVYRSLVQRGVPQAAGLAFLIATPEVGLTALFVSLPLLGAEYTLLRVGAAAVLATFVAYVLTRLVPAPARFAAPAASACCAHDHGHAHGGGARPAHSPTARLRRALHAGLVELVDGTAPWIIAGLAIAAFAVPYVQQVYWAQLPDSMEVLVFALLGMPVYVCAAGATPLVAVLIAGGVSPGAAIAFLLTGPATNVATFGVLRALHGRRLALAFAALTAAGAVAIGLLVNPIAPQTPPPVAEAHAREASLLQIASLVLLTLLFAASLLRQGGRGFLAELAEGVRVGDHA